MNIGPANAAVGNFKPYFSFTGSNGFAFTDLKFAFFFVPQVCGGSDAARNLGQRIEPTLTFVIKKH